nr:hypothetical protein [Tanacetum cinerariifolium]
MTGNLKLLSNFVEKFLGKVKFGNDKIAPIIGYGDLVQGNSTCYIRDLKGNDLLIAEIVTTSNELDLLFSLMFDELLNGTTLVVSKSFTVTTADARDKHQLENTTPSTSTTIVADTPPLNIQTTPESTSKATTQAPTVNSTENINQAET